MTVSYNPSIAVQNLAFLVDTANPKSYTNGENLWTWSENQPLGLIGGGGGNTFFVNTATTVTPTGTTASTLVLNASTSNQYNFMSEQFGGSFPGYYTMSYYVKPYSTSTITMILGTNGFNQYYSSGTVWATVYINPITTAMSVRGLSNSNTNVNTIADFKWGSIPAANGWTRYWLTANLTTTTGAIATVLGGFYIGDPGTCGLAAGTGVYTWGWQLEASSTVTNYVPTTSVNSPRSLTWTDLTGRGNNLSINSYVLYTANLGQAMATGVFTTNSSTQSYASISQQFFNTSSATNVSYSFMINANWAANQYYQTLMGMQSSGFASVATLVMASAPGLLYLDFRSPAWGSADRNIISYDMTPYTNRWCLITYTFNAGQHTLYVNNQQVAQATGSNTLFPPWPSGVAASGYALGTNIDSARPIGDAKISWSAVYNKTLSLSEVTQNYNALRGRYGI